MKALVTDIEVFGPFTTVEQLADRWLCDGDMEIQFDVIGDAFVRDWSAEDYSPTLHVEIVPEVIQMRQCRRYLIDAGIDEDVENAIEAITDPVIKKTIRVEFEYNQTVRRYNPWVLALANSLGWTSEQLDMMFINASKIIDEDLV